MIISILITIPSSFSLYGQEKPFAATHWGYSGGLEFNRFSSNTNFATGVNLSYSPMENRYAVFSLRAVAAYNFADTYGGDFAWRFQFPFLYSSKTQLFIGVEQGICYVNKDDGAWWTLTINGTLSGRIFLGKQFFIEPYGRVGLPVLFAVGILVGMRYSYK
jgi:hypothetical protein